MCAAIVNHPPPLKKNYAPSFPPDLHLFLIFAVSSSLMPESVGIYDVSDTLCVLWRGGERVRKSLLKFTSVDQKIKFLENYSSSFYNFYVCLLHQATLVFEDSY